MSSPATIDDLPPEMIRELFKHLHLMDLTACSVVNKRWHLIYAGFRVQRLVVFMESDYHHFDKWSYPDRRVEAVERCHSAMFNHLIDQPLLSNLKYLALCGYDFHFYLNKLNQFEQLVHLEINSDGVWERNENLNMPKLKVLACYHFDNWHYWHSSLSIDCPELNVLVYYERDEESPLDVKHPETIRKLVTNMVGVKLAPFKNAECLITRRLDVLSRETLLLLPKLKKLRYIDRSKIGTIDRIKQTLKEFVGHLKGLKRSDFQFRFQLNEARLGEIDFGVQVDEDGKDTVYEYTVQKN